METTEKIVECYCRYIQKWFTITNVGCGNQQEIDILAINPITGEKCHIECGVSISGSFSKLTAKPFDPELLKDRVKAPAQRRTIGYFIQKKFGSPEIIKKLEEFGFCEGQYTRIIVTWGWTLMAKKIADQKGVILWDMRTIFEELVKLCQETKSYSKNDTMRTLQLFVRRKK